MILGLMVIGLVTIGVSCQRSTVEVAPTTPTEGTVTVLSASTPSAAETRLNITHPSETAPISITWRNGGEAKPLETDVVSVFNATTKEWMANFSYSGANSAQTGEFTMVDGGTALSEGNYVAVYPAVDGSVITNLDMRDAQELPDSEFVDLDLFLLQPSVHLNGKIWMKAEFSVAADNSAETMVFKHETAVMLIKFPLVTTDDIPTHIHFRDGDNDYRINENFSYPAGTVSQPLRVYRVIRPNSGARTLHFSTMDNIPEYNKHYTMETDKEYQAGVIYTADLSNTPTPAENITAIYRESDLLAIRDLSNTIELGEYVTVDIDITLMNDITLTEEWAPICNRFKNMYGGTFDGNGYSIYGMRFNGSLDGFALIGNNRGTLKNITIVEPSITNTVPNTAVICSENQGTIINCASIGGSIKGTSYVASIASNSRWGEPIIGCYSSTDITSVDGITGGITPYSSELIGCYYTGTLTNEGNLTQTRFGLILGSSTQFSSLIGCYSTGEMVNIPNPNAIGYSNSIEEDAPITVSEVYYVSAVSNGVFGDQNVLDIAELNTKVDAMNAAIAAAGYPEIQYTVNPDPTKGPTLRGEVL